MAVIVHLHSPSYTCQFFKQKLRLGAFVHKHTTLGQRNPLIPPTKKKRERLPADDLCWEDVDYPAIYGIMPLKI